MKKIFTILLAILTISIVSSCQKDESSDQETLAGLSLLPWGQESTVTTASEDQSEYETSESLKNHIAEAAAESLYIAVGDGGSIYLSSDGYSWSDGGVVADYNLSAIAYGEDVFVAVGESGKLHTFDGGATWTGEGKKNDRLRDILYADSRFIAAGEAGRRVVSRDGVNWTNDLVNGADLYTLAYGVIWMEIDGVFDLYNTFVSGGFKGRTTRSHTGGASWKEYPVDSNYDVNALLYSETHKKFFGVGDNGLIVSSPDGSTWTVIAENTGYRLRALAEDNGTIIAVGDNGRITTTTNGSDWTDTLAGDYDSNTLSSITRGTDLWVATGKYGAIKVSTNGTSWTTVYTASTNLNDVTQVNATLSDSSSHLKQVCHTHWHVHEEYNNLRHTHWHCHNLHDRKNIHDHVH